MFIIETPLKQWVFSSSHLSDVVFLSLGVSHCCSRRGLLIFESVLVSHVRDPYLHQFALFSETQTRVEPGPLKNAYGKDTGKIMTTPRRGHRQGCKTHLNFIPGIVTAFQSGLGQNYSFRFLQKEYNRGGRGMIKQSQMNKFILCSVKSYIPIFLKLLWTHRLDLREHLLKFQK